MKPGVHIHGEPGAILDGSQVAGAVVSALSGVERTAVLSGFVIRRGRQAGILLNQAQPTIRNNIITENVGAGVYCAQASPHVVNNVFMANRGGGVVCEFPQTEPMLTYNAFWQNNNADQVNCPMGPGNVFVDPRFVSLSGGDYRLQEGSPLRDAGDPVMTLQDADGSRGDIGVYGGPSGVALVRQDKSSAVASEGAISAPGLLRSGLSFQGLPGIIDIPTATTVPEGHVDLAYNTKLDSDIFVGRRQADRQQNFNFAFGLLPRLTVGGRGAVATDIGGGRRGQDEDVTRDISANVQALLWQEGVWWPSVALGAQDLGGGNRLFESKYIVLSKSAFGRMRGTVGFGTGPDTLDGLFAGVEVAVNPFITLLGEYDATDINAGVRLFPVPEQWEAYGIPRVTVDLIWQDGEDFAWGVQLRSPLGEEKYRAQRTARATKQYQRQSLAQAKDVSLQALSEQVQAALIDYGFENVRVAMVRQEKGMTVVVEYENRLHNRDELEGLGVALGLVAMHTPTIVTDMSLIVKKVNLPVLQFTTGIEAFLSFLNEQTSEVSFAQQVFMTSEVQKIAEPTLVDARTTLGNRSWFKVDAILRPGIETTILTERGVADMRFRLLPDAFVQLTPGTVVNVRGNIPVTVTPGFPGDLAEPAVDRALLHQAFAIPLGGWSRVASGFTQLSVGRFSKGDVGVASETAFSLAQGLFQIKGTVARLGSWFDDLDRWHAVGTARVRYPSWDLTLSLSGGLFLDEDKGIVVELSRFFGNTEIGLFLRHSDNGSQGGMRLALPLTPAKDLKPMYLRPRLPELFTYTQSTTVFEKRNIIRGDIGRMLNPGHEIDRVYWNRDRLYPVYIKQHFDVLKHAVRRWVEDKVESVSSERRN